jgi:hypothetical protein
LPEGQLVAASCHDLEQLQAAQQLGCDFAVLGPVQATASHPGAVPLGWKAFAALRAQVSLPIYALGGMAAAISPKRVGMGRASLRFVGCGRREPACGVRSLRSRALTPSRQSGSGPFRWKGSDPSITA